MSLRDLQNMPIYFPSGKYELSICFFIATQYFIPVTIFSGAPLKRITGEDDRNTQMFFTPELDKHVYLAFHL